MALRTNPVATPKSLVAAERMLYDSTPRPLAGPPADYYRPADGKVGQPLLDALHGVVKNGHHPLGYDQARNALFGLVEDTDGDNKVPDLYSGILQSGVT